jgi:hypothetical protein
MPIVSWSQVLKTCMHGVKEGVDSHDCPQCADIARLIGLEVTQERTYIFLSQEHVDNCKRKRIEIARAKGLLKE